MVYSLENIRYLKSELAHYTKKLEEFRQNMADLKRLVYPGDMEKICKMLELTGSSRDVADPWFTGDFEMTYSDVVAGCAVLLECIEKSRKA